MRKKKEKIYSAGIRKKQKDDDLPGYEPYPEEEDIFKKSAIEEDLDPDDLKSVKKTEKKPPNTLNEIDFKEDKSGQDLDIPGTELDDEQENIGSEDEENNYYSLGGDEKENLEEDKGD